VIDMELAVLALVVLLGLVVAWAVFSTLLRVLVWAVVLPFRLLGLVFFLVLLPFRIVFGVIGSILGWLFRPARRPVAS
jgi:hypothetical protein